MQIEVWSDFVCPFCYIGKRRFDAALESFQERNQINVTYKSYQLDPKTPAYHGQDYLESLAEKFGSAEQAKQMTEEDIKYQYIYPAIENGGWPRSSIAMEKAITDGKINIRGNIVVRSSPKKADYVLYIEKNYPIAIVEAKDNKHSVSHGIQQAKEYCKMMDVPFAYSSNGDAFQEYEKDFK